MTMLIAFALARVRWMAIIAAALFVIELYAAPIRWYLAPRDVPPVYHWVATQKVRIIEVPFDQGEAEYAPMLWSTAHHRPMANGVSGFVPPEFLRLSAMWHAPEVGGAFVDELRRIDIDLVMVRGNEVSDRERRGLHRELAHNRLGFVRRFDRDRSGDWVFSTHGGGGAVPADVVRGDST